MHQVTTAYACSHCRRPCDVFNARAQGTGVVLMSACCGRPVTMRDNNPGELPKAPSRLPQILAPNEELNLEVA